jgi:hypothetical protein
MELKSILQELRGVAYYKITAYGVKWWHFHDHVELTLKLIVDVETEIKVNRFAIMKPVQLS